jgi:hypothetical protein
MNHLDKFITTEIIKYLPNESVFNISFTSKFNNELFDHTLIKHIRYRMHPAVFNIIDNYCNRCNMSSIFFLDENLVFERCKHLN